VLWRGIARWALVAVAAPVVAAGVRKVGRAMEARRGPSGASRLLTRSADGLQRLSGRGRRRGR
jgi:hypothetical protein